MRTFLKRLFCFHYWNDGEPLRAENPFGVRKFTCDKCGCTKVRKWNWGINENVWKGF